MGNTQIHLIQQCFKVNTKKVTKNYIQYQHKKVFYHTNAPHTTQNSMWHPKNITGKQIIPNIQILTLIFGTPRCRILKEQLIHFEWFIDQNLDSYLTFSV